MGRLDLRIEPCVANDGEITAIALRHRPEGAIAPVQKFVYRSKDKFTTNKILAFFYYELPQLWRMSSGIGYG